MLAGDPRWLGAENRFVDCSPTLGQPPLETEVFLRFLSEICLITYDLCSIANSFEVKTARCEHMRDCESPNNDQSGPEQAR